MSLKSWVIRKRQTGTTEELRLVKQIREANFQANEYCILDLNA